MWMIVRCELCQFLVCTFSHLSQRIMAQMLSIYAYACTRGTRKLSCCSWHFMQSHQMTKQKIHVDEFAGKVCVATNHRVFLVYSQLLHQVKFVKVLRSGKECLCVCALIFLSTRWIRFYTVQQHITMFSHRCAYHCDDVCKIWTEHKHSASISSPYVALPVSIRMCRNIFKSTSLSPFSLPLALPPSLSIGSESFSLKRTGNKRKQNWSEKDIASTYEKGFALVRN